MVASVGLTGDSVMTVTEDDLADAVGSGAVRALATPRLLALVEAATVRALEDALDPGLTSVGSRILLSHRRPSPVGATVTAHARVVRAEDRLVTFEFSARHEDGAEVAVGEIGRVVVDEAEFNRSASALPASDQRAEPRRHE